MPYRPVLVLLTVVSCLGRAVGGEEAQPATPAAPAAPASQPSQGVNAYRLAEAAFGALAGIDQVLQEPGGKLDPKLLLQKPFFSLLRRMVMVGEAARRQLKRKDPHLTQSLTEGTELAAALRAAYPRSGIQDERVRKGLVKLSAAWTQLRLHYGKEAIRIREGGALNTDELAALRRLKDEQEPLQQRLKLLEAEAKASPRLSAELTRLRSRSSRILEAKEDLEGFFGALHLVDLLAGEWRAYSYYVSPELRKAWHDADFNLIQTFSAWDTIYLQSTAVYVWEEWAAFDKEVALGTPLDPGSDPVGEAAEACAKHLKASCKELTTEAYYQEAETLELKDAPVEEWADPVLDWQAVQGGSAPAAGGGPPQPPAGADPGAGR